MKKPVFRTSPEAAIQEAIISFLERRGWYVKATHGNAYTSGWPDLYCFHKKHGYRWIDVKNPKRFGYTKAQIQQWPDMHEAGIGIWIMFAADEENYSRLFNPPNWRDFWKPSYDKYRRSVESILDEMEQPE